MNPDDIIKAAPEIAKGAGALAAAIPFTSIVKRMLGPAADELAAQLANEIKVYRYGRSLKLLEKAEKMAQVAGFTPTSVPIKLLFPLLEGASLEEDENLHDMWAALLANAASPDGQHVRPAFIAILREMAPDEAKLMQWFYDTLNSSSRRRIDRLDVIELCSLVGSPVDDMVERRILACIDGLEASQLIRRSYFNRERDKDAVDRKVIKYRYLLTDRGYQFVQACRPPKPKS